NEESTSGFSTGAASGSLPFVSIHGAVPRPSRRTRGAAWLLAIAVTSLPGRLAHAGDSKAADEHFKRGKELLARGRVAEACAELATSDALDPSVGTLGLLAACHE